MNDDDDDDGSVGTCSGKNPAPDCFCGCLWPGFSLGRLHMGGGQVQGDKALMGGTHEGGHRPYRGGPNFDRLYHKLKSTVIVKLQLHYTICRL